MKYKFNFDAATAFRCGDFVPMKLNIKHLLTFILTMSINCYNLGNVSAMEVNRSTIVQSQLQQSYTWYDGSVARTVWLNPQLLAEFNPSADSQQQIVKSINNANIVLNQTGSLRIWQLGDSTQSPNTNSLNAVNVLRNTNPTGRFSAVLNDNPTSQSRLRALPGNIIVYFNPQWDQTTIDQWFIDSKLIKLQKLAIGTNVYLIETAPGIASLLKANEIYESGQVDAAFPNWWQEYITR